MLTAFSFGILFVDFKPGIPYNRALIIYRIFTGRYNLEALNGKQRRYLSSLANSIKATVMIGKNGLTDNTLLSIRNAFNTQELVKIKIQDGCPDETETMVSKIEAGTEAQLVQILGHTLLFYRRDRDHPRLQLP